MNASDVTIEERVVVFIDIHHFSLAFAGALESYQFLQAMYEGLGELITVHGGEIIKYLGDSIMSVFPAGYELQAVECGRKMRDAFAKMVRTRGLPAEIELEVGIGAGSLAVGVCGHPTLRLKDVFGEAVTHAAMIGHYRGVAVTESVYEQIKHRYATRRLPDIPTRKPEEPLKVWAILQEHESGDET